MQITPNDSLAELFNPIASSQGFQLKWTVYPDLFYFNGHFPEMPIVPAVGLVDLSLACVGQFLKQKIELESVLQAKFYRPMAPSQEVQITGTQEGENIWILKWEDPVQQQNLAQIKLQIQNRV